MSQTSAIAANQIKTFGSPAGNLDPTNLAFQARGNDNVTVTAFNTHDADTTIHVNQTITTGVGAGATAIYPAITGRAAAWIGGSNGSASFADQVAWNGATNTKAVVSSTSLDGSPAARTYTVASGVLKVAMASSTYTITVCPVQF